MAVVPVRALGRAAVVVLGAACGGTDAPLDVPPPPMGTPPTSELTVGYHAPLAAYRDPTGLRVRLGEGAAREVSGRDLTTTVAGSDWRYSAPLSVPTTGTLPAHVVLLGAASDTLAAVRVAVALAPGYRFGVSVYVPRAFPRAAFEPCGGTVTPVAIRGTERADGRGGVAADTLFVLTGGLPKGAIC